MSLTPRSLAPPRYHSETPPDTRHPTKLRQLSPLSILHSPPLTIASVHSCPQYAWSTALHSPQPPSKVTGIRHHCYLISIVTWDPIHNDGVQGSEADYAAKQQYASSG
eukprot:scaffold42755_cov72-Cyclotella_meneghiniana.AAC.5